MRCFLIASFCGIYLMWFSKLPFPSFSFVNHFLMTSQTCFRWVSFSLSLFSLQCCMWRSFIQCFWYSIFGCGNADSSVWRSSRELIVCLSCFAMPAVSCIFCGVWVCLLCCCCVVLCCPVVNVRFLLLCCRVCCGVVLSSFRCVVVCLLYAVLSA